MAIQIVVDVTGEAAGSPGVSREFPFSKIDPTSPTATLSVVGSGITSYFWEILSQPVGASAVLSGDTDPTPSFDPTELIAGTYLIQCTVNGGADFARICLAFTTKHLAIRKPAPGEEAEFDVDRGWEPALAEVIDYTDANSQIGGARLRAVIDFAISTAVPPSEVDGDRYILDDSGAPEAAWDGAAQLDVVQFDKGVWVAYTPEEGDNAYVDGEDTDYRFIDDGAPAWEEVQSGGSLNDAYIIGRIITADGGAVRINVPNTSNTPALELYNEDSTNNPYGLQLGGASLYGAVLYTENNANPGGFRSHVLSGSSVENILSMAATSDAADGGGGGLLTLASFGAQSTNNKAVALFESQVDNANYDSLAYLNAVGGDAAQVHIANGYSVQSQADVYIATLGLHQNIYIGSDATDRIDSITMKSSNGDITITSSADLWLGGNVGIVGSALRFDEVAKPTRVADKGFVYGKDVSGVTELFYMDDFVTGSGREVQITSGGVIAGGGGSLDDAYNYSGGASSIGVDAGDVTWNLSGTYSFAIDMSGATGSADGFLVENGADYFRVRRGNTDVINWYAEVGSININSGGAFALSGDSTMGLTTSGGTITLNPSTFTVIDSPAWIYEGVRLNEMTKPTRYADKGWVYSKDVSGVTELFYMDDDSGSSGREVQLTSAGAALGGGSLDTAYDFGGAGAGRTITADNGPVYFVAPAAADDYAFQVDQNDTVASHPILGDWPAIYLGGGGVYGGVLYCENLGDSEPMGMVSVSYTGSNEMLYYFANQHVSTGDVSMNVVNYAVGGGDADTYFQNWSDAGTGLSSMRFSNRTQGTGATSRIRFAADNEGTGNAEIEFNSSATSGTTSTLFYNMDYISFGNGTYLRINQRTGDPSGHANDGSIYTKDVSGITELFYYDDDSNAVQITSGGAVAGGGGGSLDDAYNGGSTVTVDAGDVLWNLSGTRSFVIDTSSMSTPSNDGFIVQQGTQFFRASPQGANSLSVVASLTAFGLTGVLNVTGNVTATGSYQYGETTKPTRQADIGFTYVKDVSGVSELFYMDDFVTGSGREVQITSGGAIAGGGGGSLDSAYNNGSTIAVDTTDVLWNLSSAKSFVIDMSGLSATDDGFHLENGTDFFRLRRDDTNHIKWTGAVNETDLTSDGGITLATARDDVFGGPFTVTLGDGQSGAGGQPGGDGGYYSFTTGDGGDPISKYDGGDGGDYDVIGGDGGFGDSSGKVGGLGGSLSHTAGDGGPGQAAANAGAGGNVVYQAGTGGGITSGAGVPGVGGYANLFGGAGGAGTGTAAGGVGGDADIDAGAGGATGGAGAGTAGDVNLGTTYADSVNIGTASNKLGVFGTTAVVQPTTGTYGVWTVLANVVSALQALGILA